MYFLKNTLTVTLLSSYFTTSVFAYNYQFRYKNEKVDRYYFGHANDLNGFYFGDSFDDLRSASLLFTYFSKYNFSLTLESHMLTYRGYITDLDDIRTRSDIFEIDFMYYFPIVLEAKGNYFGELNFGVGIKNLIYGNLGGDISQKGLHLLIGQDRPIVKIYDPYDYRGFISTSINYSFLNFIHFENYFDLSYFADYFYKTSIGINLGNEDLSFETKLYYQVQNKLKNWTTYNHIQESESGFGFYYELSSKNFFAFKNITFQNFSSSNKNFSLGGVGIIFSEEYERKGKNLYSLNKKVSINYDFIIKPSLIKGGIYFEPLENFYYYFSITTGYDIENKEDASFVNRFSAGLKYELFKYFYFSLYFESGLAISKNTDFKETKLASRPILYKELIKVGIDLEVGIGFDIFRYNEIDYTFKIFTKINESPIVYNLYSGKLEENSFIFYYLGVGIIMKN